MNDTNPEIQIRLNEFYLNLTHEERFEKMMSMCQTVRELISSQLPPEISYREKRIKLFEIYYKQDFCREKFDKWFKIIFGNEI